jgi:hypothetical protein
MLFFGRVTHWLLVRNYAQAQSGCLCHPIGKLQFSLRIWPLLLDRYKLANRYEEKLGLYTEDILTKHLFTI